MGGAEAETAFGGLANVLETGSSLLKALARDKAKERAKAEGVGEKDNDGRDKKKYAKTKDDTNKYDGDY